MPRSRRRNRRPKAEDKPPSADDRRTCNSDRVRGRAGASRDERHPIRWSAGRRRAASGDGHVRAADHHRHDGRRVRGARGAAAAQHPARRASRSGEPNLAGPAWSCATSGGRLQPWRGRRCRAPGVLVSVRGRRFARAARNCPLMGLMTSSAAGTALQCHRRATGRVPVMATGRASRCAVIPADVCETSG